MMTCDFLLIFLKIAPSSLKKISNWLGLLRTMPNYNSTNIICSYFLHALSFYIKNNNNVLKIFNVELKIWYRIIIKRVISGLLFFRNVGTTIVKIVPNNLLLCKMAVASLYILLCDSHTIPLECSKKFSKSSTICMHAFIAKRLVYRNNCQPLKVTCRVSFLIL